MKNLAKTFGTKTFCTYSRFPNKCTTTFINFWKKIEDFFFEYRNTKIQQENE